MKSRDKAGLVALLLLTALTLALNLWNLGFPLGYHADEPGKVRQILEGGHTFFHPLLLIQTARVFYWVSGGGGEESALLAGRAVSALAGALLVPAVFLLARRGLPPLAALLAAATAALAPITVIHAHYLKEDVLLTLFVVVSLVAALHLAENPSWKGALGWGIAGGLMLASKYPGVLFLGIQLAFLLWTWRREDRPRWRFLAVGVAVALAIFALVNLPALADPTAAREGVLFEARHALSGHGPFSFTAPSFLGLFHLRFSLAPGFGVPLLVLLLGGVLFLFLPVRLARARREILPIDRLALISASALYLLAELSPTKPFPDAMRYMLPLVPLLALLGVRGLWRLRGLGRIAFPAGLTLWLLVLGLAALRSVSLVVAIDEDPREDARRWAASHAEPIRWEHFTAVDSSVDSVARLDPTEHRAEGVRYLAASSFLYEWIFLACDHGGCTPEGEALAEGYRRLFQCDYLEMRPEVPAFAFHRPTLRIVDLERCPPEYDL